MAGTAVRASSSRSFPLFLLLSCLLLFSSSSSAAASKKHSTTARKDDIPYIKCQVCHKIANQIHHQLQHKAHQLAPAKLSELHIIEIVENLCNLKKQEADWILQIDILHTADQLQLVEQGVEGHCNSICKTIERACQQVMEFADTDVAEFYYKNQPSIDQLVDYLCHDLSQACSVNTPPVPKDRKPGEPFVPKPSKDAEMEKILKSMQDMPGAPNMKMYSREDLMNNNFGGDDDGDEDEDEDDDEDNIPKNLGKVFKNKETPKEDLKEKILKGVAEKSKQVKRHINNASKQIKKWWKGFKKPGKKSPSKSSKSSKSSKNEL